MGRHPMGEGVDPNPRIVAERLVDPDALVMGKTAENLHDRFPHAHQGARRRASPSRSQEKTAAAYADGKIQPDLVPVATRSAELGWGLATADEPPRPGTTLEDARRASRRRSARTAGSPPATPPASTTAPPPACSPPRTSPTSSACRSRMRLVGYAFAGVEPEVMGVGPIPATEKALRQAGLTIDDIGLFEINEAFAVQVLAFLDHFGIADDDPRVNPYGGAIAIGPPAGLLRRPADDPARPPVRGAPRGPLRPDHHVHRPRHGRHRHLGEPALRPTRDRVTRRMSDHLLTRAEAISSDDEVVTHAHVRDVDPARRRRDARR